MAETFFEEMCRYIGFGADDGAALRRLVPHATPHFAAIAERFYARIAQHDDARNVFADQAQVDRLKGTLQVWMAQLLGGPWDEDYYQTRARIGRRHVEIALPQRYVFGAMDLIRISLVEIAADAEAAAGERHAIVAALHKILDIELAIMLETFAEAFVAKVQHFERVEKELLVQRLALTEARYQEIVEKGEALIVTWEPGRPIVLFNRRCEELTGMDRAAARATTWFEIFGAGRDDPMRANELDLLEGRRQPPFETSLIAPDGTEHRVRWQLTTLLEPDRATVCAIGLDVTEEHELAVRTGRAERLASLGTMAAGLAHEIRNPLNSANLQLTLVDRRLGRATPDVRGAREATGLAAGEIKRLAGLVGEFLDFARPQPLRRSRADLRQTAEVIVALVKPEAGTVGVDLELDPGEPVLAECDDEKLKQVLHNLVRNALEATGAGGTVRIRVAERRADAVIEIEDDGPGFSPDAPVFEPFFTTKETGTGLGLAIVHRIVADHGGAVTVRSRPGSTVFTVNVPLLGP